MGSNQDARVDREVEKINASEYFKKLYLKRDSALLQVQEELGRVTVDRDYFIDVASERFDRIDDLELDLERKENSIARLEDEIGETRKRATDNLNVCVKAGSELSDVNAENDRLNAENGRLQAITRRHIKRLQILDGKWRLFSSALETVSRMVPEDAYNAPIRSFVQAVIDAAENKDYQLEKELEEDE
jgi:hypothetical protein